MNSLQIDRQKILTGLYAITLAGFGQLLALMIRWQRGEKFKLVNWISKIAVACIVGFAVKDFIPINSNIKDFWLIASGVSAEPIVFLMEKYILKVVAERRLGIKEEDIGPKDNSPLAPNKGVFDNSLPHNKESGTNS